LFTKASIVSLHSLATLSSACFVKETSRNHLPIPNAAYAPTKTALNWYTRRIDAEDDWLNCFTIDPGHVSTDLGDAAAQMVLKVDHAPTSVQESCDAMMNILAKASKKEYGGKLAVFTGGFHEW
jgi:NAD(P)-dependent dehydrogenase (short-subunit alcohol dehydrogenase family)